MCRVCDQVRAGTHKMGEFFGRLTREGDKLSVAMSWVLSEEVDCDFRREFLKQRCHDLNGQFREYGAPEFGGDRKSSIKMTYMWSSSSVSWETLKAKFTNAFEVALDSAVLGKSAPLCHEDDSLLEIGGKFAINNNAKEMS